MFDIAVVSGYFNPLHSGHLRMMQAAREHARTLVVIVNNDQQQRDRGDQLAVPCRERMEQVGALEMVDQVVESIDHDTTVGQTLQLIADDAEGKTIVFCNGGARSDTRSVPETAVCQWFGIEQLFGVGGSEPPEASELPDSGTNH